MSRTRLVLLPADPGAAAPFLMLDADGRVLERGHLSVDGPVLSGARVRTVAIVPGTEVLVRWLTLPAGRPVQQKAAALWALREDLAVDPASMRVALGPDAVGSPRLVAAVDDARLGEWTGRLATLGVEGATLVPDCLVPDAPEEADRLRSLVFGPAVAVRGQGLAVSVQPDLVPVIAAGRTVEPIDNEADIEARLVATALAPSVDLGGGQTRASSAEGWKAWRLAAGLALALLLSPLVLTAATAIRDDMAASRLRDDAEARARALFPDMAADADPLDEARRRLALTPPPGGVAVVAAVLFQALEGVPGAELDSLTADPVSGVRATVSYTAFQDLEAIRSGVEALGLRMVEEATLEEGDRIASDIIVGVGA